MFDPLFRLQTHGHVVEAGHGNCFSVGIRHLSVHRDLAGIEGVGEGRGNVGRQFDVCEEFHALPVQRRLEDLQRSIIREFEPGPVGPGLGPGELRTQATDKYRN